jgi:hypothetical protein
MMRSNAVAEFLLKRIVALIELVAHRDYALDVAHAIHERHRDRGAWAALRSAAGSLARCLNADAKLAAALVYVAVVVLGLARAVSDVTPLMTTIANRFESLPLAHALTIAAAIALMAVYVTGVYFAAAFASRLVVLAANHDLRGVARACAVAAAAYLAQFTFTFWQQILAQPSAAHGTARAGWTALCAALTLGLVAGVFSRLWHVRRTWHDRVADAYVRRLEG